MADMPRRWMIHQPGVRKLIFLKKPVLSMAALLQKIPSFV